MHPFLINKKIDLVDFGDVKLFMFEDDDLYDLCVPEARKHQSLEEHHRAVARDGYPPSPVNPDTVKTVRAAQFCLPLVLTHLWDQGFDVTVLDIGAFVGDFSLRMANVIRSFGRRNQVYAFDPTEAGALIPYNIRLNGLEAIVRHEERAVAGHAGLALFNLRPGSSDASFSFRSGGHQLNVLTLAQHFVRTRYKTAYLRKVFRFVRPQPTYNLVVDAMPISIWVRERRLQGALFAKIDVEGLSPIVLEDLLSLGSEDPLIVVFEFSPLAVGSLGEAAGLLRRLATSFHLFDIWYSPTPTRCQLIVEGALEAFAREIAHKRVFCYTDVLLVPRTLPDVAGLVERLEKLEWTNEEYVL